MQKEFRFECFSRGKRRVVKGLLVAKIPAGHVPDKAVLKSEGYRINWLKNAEKRQGRDHESFILADSKNLLYWPRLCHVHPV